ncbi:MAG: hypothetical protein K2Z81_13665, partial [Cyanobacteria bacterium]|nr:hypothetical protein [Cyanobacteriota bacterium]
MSRKKETSSENETELGLKHLSERFGRVDFLIDHLNELESSLECCSMSSEKQPFVSQQSMENVEPIKESI